MCRWRMSHGKMLALGQQGREDRSTGREGQYHWEKGPTLPCAGEDTQLLCPQAVWPFLRSSTHPVHAWEDCPASPTAGHLTTQCFLTLPESQTCPHARQLTREWIYKPRDRANWTPRCGGKERSETSTERPNHPRRPSERSQTRRPRS